MLLLAYLASIAATVAAGAFLARQMFNSVPAQRWSVLLFSVALGVPIAGTSLYLADPYLTARSASTPLLLCALAWMLRGRPAACNI